MTSSLLKKMTEIEDLATAEFFEIYEFKKSDGSYGRVEVKPSAARDIRAFTACLLDAGAKLPINREKASNLIKKAVAADPKERILFAQRTGWWQRKRRGFVRTRSFIGASQTTISGIRIKDWGSEQGATFYKGSLRDWRDSVGSIAKDSSFLMTAICAAFAAPLLKVIGQKSFAICLSGPSRSGKTVAINAAASVIGCGDSDHLLSWNMTANHLEERLREFNDCLFPIDDLEVVRGNARERYQQIRDMAYHLAQGHGKGRHSLYESGNIRKSWRSIMLTSAEKTVASLASAAREKRNDGELIRLIDLPVTSRQTNHIFDLASEAKDNGWRAQRFQELSQACRANHGRAFKRYIQKLIALGPRVEQRAQVCIAHFVDVVSSNSGGAVAHDLAQKFGVLYAGGRLAIQFGILPWTKHELLAAITKSYHAAISVIPTDDAVLAKGQGLMRSFLSGLSDKRDLDAARYKAISGFRARSKKRDCFGVRCQKFHDIFESPHQRRLVIDWLLKSGQLVTADPKRRKSQPALGAEKSPQVQFDWPDQKRRRSYTISIRRDS